MPSKSKLRSRGHRNEPVRIKLIGLDYQAIVRGSSNARAKPKRARRAEIAKKPNDFKHLHDYPWFQTCRKQDYAKRPRVVDLVRV